MQINEEYEITGADMKLLFSIRKSQDEDTLYGLSEMKFKKKIVKRK